MTMTAQEPVSVDVPREFHRRMAAIIEAVQTGKIRRIPVLLFGRDFWERVVDFQALVETGRVCPSFRRPSLMAVKLR